MWLLELLMPSLRRPARRAFSRIESRAFTAGLISGDPKWRGLLFGIWAWRILSKVIRRQPERVSIERLGVGETIVVRALGRDDR